MGLNVATDQKLYIARCIEQIDMDKADFSGSTTLNHWAVVIQDSGGYVYTHAVGNVVSGEGIKIPFREIKEDKLGKYRLDHVGFVTRNHSKFLCWESVPPQTQNVPPPLSSPVFPINT